MVKEIMGLSIMTAGRLTVTVSKGRFTPTLPAMAPDYYRRNDRPDEMTTYLPLEKILFKKVDLFTLA